MISLTNIELELFKLITSEISEYGWDQNGEFLVFPYWFQLDDFFKQLKSIFGNSIFDDGGFQINIEDGYAGFNLVDIVGNYGIDLESIFPIDKYKH